MKQLSVRGMSMAETRAAFPFSPIIVGYRGSIAHGMYLANTDPNSIDDKDIMGVGSVLIYHSLQYQLYDNLI